MKKYFIFIILLLAQLNFAGINVNTQVNNKVISIITFKNTTNNANFNWLTEAISDSITVDIAKLDVLKVVERADLKKILIEQQLSNSNLADPNYAIKVGKLLSAQLILTGDFIIVGNELRINAKIINVERGNIVSAYAINGDKSKLFNMCRKIIIELMTRMSITLDEGKLKVLGDATVPTTNMQAVEANYNGVILQDANNNQEAIKYFKKAIDLDRNYNSAINNFVNTGIKFTGNNLATVFENQFQRIKYFDIIFPRLYLEYYLSLLKGFSLSQPELIVEDEDTGILNFKIELKINDIKSKLIDFLSKLELIKLTKTTIENKFELIGQTYNLSKKMNTFLINLGYQWTRIGDKQRLGIILEKQLQLKLKNSRTVKIELVVVIPDMEHFINIERRSNEHYATGPSTNTEQTTIDNSIQASIKNYDFSYYSNRFKEKLVMGIKENDYYNSLTQIDEHQDYIVFSVKLKLKREIIENLDRIEILNEEININKLILKYLNWQPTVGSNY